MGLKATSLSWVGAVCLSVAVLCLAWQYRQSTPDISDPIGYIQASHQLARGQGLAYVDSHNEIGRHYYTLYAFKVARPAEPNPYLSFPPGMPLLAAAAERLAATPEAVQAVAPLMAALLIGIAYCLGRWLISDWAGWWAALTLATLPILFPFATSLWSEIPSATVLYLGCLMAVGAFRPVRDSVGTMILAAASGLALGFTWFMRTSNVSALPALAWLIWILYAGRPAARGRAICLGLALCVALAALLIFNILYYGGPLITGYSPVHGWYDQPAFSLAYAWSKSFVGGPSLPALGSGLLQQVRWVLPFVLLGLVVRPRLIEIWLLALPAALLAPYAIYAFPASGINARFVIPAMPALCLLAGRGIVLAGNWLRASGWRWALGIALAASLLLGWPAQLAALRLRNQASAASVERVRELVAQTEPNAVVMSYTLNDIITAYGHRSVLTYRHIVPYDPGSARYQYERFSDLLVDEVSRLLAQGVPVYYVLNQPDWLDSDQILRQRLELQPVSENGILYRVTYPTSLK